jgi:pyruvate formate lyase activating enzyme
MIGRTYAPGFDTGAEPRVHDVFSDYNLKTLIQ